MLIIHGEDIKRSYEFLQQNLASYRLQNVDIYSHNIADMDITSLRQEIGSDNLFSDKKVVVISGLLSSAKSKAKEEIAKMLSGQGHTEIILYETKEVTPTSLKLFQGSRNEVFKVNPIIFKLMDSLRPGYQKAIFSLYNQVIESGMEPEYVFAMLIRQIRLLIQIKTNPNSVRLAPFAKRLFQTQAQYFDTDKLTELHHHLYKIEKKIKTGSSSADSDHLIHHFLQSI